MPGFLVRRLCCRITICLHEHKPRRIIMQLDDIKTQNARLQEAQPGIAERRLFKPLHALRLDMDMNVNDQHV